MTYGSSGRLALPHILVCLIQRAEMFRVASRVTGSLLALGDDDLAILHPLV